MKVKSMSKTTTYRTEYDNGWIHEMTIYDPHLPEEIGIYDFKIEDK